VVDPGTEKNSLPSEEIKIRAIELSDAVAAAALSGELGYPSTAEVFQSRIEGLNGAGAHAVFVAAAEGKVIGWVDVSLVEHLASDPYAEIGGLVVAEGFRSRGVGERLMRHAEQWAVAKGRTKLLVRSRVVRDKAHRFYQRIGYREVKVSKVFEKHYESSANA
jgi:GNAT superfamily N-acetyltransferase